MNYYDRFYRMNNTYGNSVAEESTTKGQLDFKNMLQDKLSPTVHAVEIQVNRKTGLDKAITTMVDIGNVSNNDQKTFDEKYVKFAYDEDVTIGTYLKWKNKNWIIAFEEEMSYDIYQNYVMKWCNNTFRYKNKGVIHELPIYVTNLTLYSDGMADSKYTSTEDGKRNILMADNDFTRDIIVDSRIMLTNKTVYRVTHINNFTMPGIRNLTVVQTVLRDEDDLENNIAWNENQEEEIVTNELSILGDDTVMVGSTKTYKSSKPDKNHSFKIKQPCNYAKGVMVDNEFKVTITSDVKVTGEKLTIQLYDLSNGAIWLEKVVSIRGFV